MKGLKNCHVHGLHSIVLSEEGGRLRRVFIAEPHHELWRNAPLGPPRLSVGYHSHHCALTIRVLTGDIGNLLLRPGNARSLTTYRYQSAIRGETPRFVPLFGPARYGCEATVLSPGESLSLAASDMHTVCVEYGRSAAWLIEEGEEDPGYLPLTLSDDDLSRFSWRDMYEPLTERQCADLLARYLPAGVP